ncbi:NAD(P)-dependent oxidoreductase [Thermodesulfobacteriota bacterium]
MTIRIVGFVGIGAMGSHMAPCIANAGFPLHVYDINTEAVDALACAHNGIVVEDSAKAVAAACDAVITMLPAGPAVQQVVLGKGGLIEGFAKGNVLIDMSSSQPWLTVELAAVLKARGIGMLDSPVSGLTGGTASAEKGSLTLMVGGDDNLIERCLPVLKPMAGHIFRTGKVGSGHALKTLNNLLSGLNTVAAAEALMVGKRFGLNPEVMVDVFNQSTGMNSATQRHFKGKVFDRNFKGGFAFDLKFKDLEIAIELAHRTQTPVPLSGLCYQLFEAARTYLGPDCSSVEVVRWVENMAGTELRKDD